MEDKHYKCESVTRGHYAGMLGANYGSGKTKGFEVGLVPTGMPPRIAGGYSGFVLGVGDVERRRVFLEFVPSFLVYIPSWYYGIGVGHEPERGGMIQATAGFGILCLLPYVRGMAFPQANQAKRVSWEFGIALKFGAIGETGTRTYQTRVRR